MYYIQCKGKHSPLETADEFTKKREAVEALIQYCIADPSAKFYISTCPCKEWADSKKVKA